jgi:hypothetical protein
MLMSFWWYSMQIDGHGGEIVYSGRFGFSVSQMYELKDAPAAARWKLVSQYVMASFDPPSDDHDK